MVVFLAIVIICTVRANMENRLHIALNKGKEQVKQYPEDFYEDSRLIFFKDKIPLADNAVE